MILNIHHFNHFTTTITSNATAPQDRIYPHSRSCSSTQWHLHTAPHITSCQHPGQSNHSVMSSATKYELPSNHSKTLVVQGGVMPHSSSRTWRLVLLALAPQPCTVPLQVKYVCSSQVTKASCPYTQTTFKAKPSPVHSSTHHTHTLLLLSHAHNAYQSGMSVLRSKVQRCVSGP